MFTADIIRLAIVAEQQVECATGDCVGDCKPGQCGVIAGPIYVGNDA